MRNKILPHVRSESVVLHTSDSVPLELLNVVKKLSMVLANVHTLRRLSVTVLLIASINVFKQKHALAFEMLAPGSLMRLFRAGWLTMLSVKLTLPPF